MEGGEGSGKSSQAKRLAAWLRGEGLSVTLTREPGGSPRAEALRTLLLDGRFREAGPETEALAFGLARADHMDEVIRPALAGGSWVVSDRFMDSTRAYQGAAGADPALLDLIEAIAVGADRPDLTLLLDVPVATGLARAAARSPSDRFERDGADIHEARRRAFLALAAQQPDRIVVIDAAGDEDGVAASILRAVTQRLRPAGPR